MSVEGDTSNPHAPAEQNVHKIREAGNMMRQGTFSPRGATCV